MGIPFALNLSQKHARMVYVWPNIPLKDLNHWRSMFQPKRKFLSVWLLVIKVNEEHLLKCTAQRKWQKHNANESQGSCPFQLFDKESPSKTPPRQSTGINCWINDVLSNNKIKRRYQTNECDNPASIVRDLLGKTAFAAPLLLRQSELYCVLVNHTQPSFRSSLHIYLSTNKKKWVLQSASQHLPQNARLKANTSLQCHCINFLSSNAGQMDGLQMPITLYTKIRGEAGCQFAHFILWIWVGAMLTSIAVWKESVAKYQYT